jgi:hypothetical protein
MRERTFGRRVGVASVVALCALAAFAVIGGTGLAGGLANPGKGQYGGQYGGQYQGKVTICHKGHVTIRVAMVAWLRAHERHGDTMGPCSAAAVKAAKLKAAKLKAAKLKAEHSQSTTHGKGAGKSAKNAKHGPKGQSGSTSTSDDTEDTGNETHGHGNGHGNNG